MFQKQKLWMAPLLLLAMSALAYAEDPAASLAAPIQSGLVQLEPLTEHLLTDEITAHGLVGASVSDETTIAMPRAGRLQQLAVAPGQTVNEGTRLFSFASDSADRLAYQQAKSQAQLVQDEWKRTERLFRQKLATKSQLEIARKALTDAQSSLATQVQLGTEKPLTSIKAPYDALVVSVSASQGDFVSTGAPILKLQKRLSPQILVGVLPEAATRIEVGMAVKVMAVFDDSLREDAKVTAINGAVDPQTRLVGVTVRFIKPNARLISGSWVRAEIVIGQKNSLAVPRAAILYDEKGSYLFQVEAGKAKRVEVETGLENSGFIAVTGMLNTSLPIVVLGNYELEDGMAVRESLK